MNRARIVVLAIALISFSVLSPISGVVMAGDDHASHEIYRGHYSDLSAVVGRKDLPKLVDGLRHQIDIAENSGLSLRVLQLLQTFPIVIDDFACAGLMTVPTSGDPMPLRADACYSRKISEGMNGEHVSVLVWDGELGRSNRENLDPVTRAICERTGVVMVRPSMLVDHRERERPVILHELLHAYHDHILQSGFANPAVQSFFKEATEKKIYPAEAYLMTNEKEFFAVTASVFLFGRDHGLDRAAIKEKQPDYYRYLVWLFEFNPERAQDVTPMASVN